MNWLLIFLGFSALIVLHEFGHFVVAKWTGMRVERFFLFFPPKIWSIKRGETEYGIGAIPLGGFVKITGMNPDELREGRPDEAEKDDDTPAGLLNKVEAAGQAQEPLSPDVIARGYYNQPVWKRIATIGAGPAMNIAIAFVILFVLALGAMKPTALGVNSIETDSPAKGVLQEGDRIVSVDGVEPKQGGSEPSGDDLSDRAVALSDQVATHKCADEQVDGCSAASAAVVVVERDGSLETLRVRPYYDADAPNDDGEDPGRARLGFSFGAVEEVPEDLSAAQAAGRSLDTMWEVTSQTVTIFSRLLEKEQREQVSGVVGISAVADQTINESARLALGLLALVSLSLAIINLFPFLPLDGGHIFWSVVEKVRGRPVSFRTMERAGAVGFALIMVLFFIGLQNDIGRLTGEGFDIR